MASDVGDDLGLDDLVYVTLGIESTIKHDQVRPTLTVYPSTNHETATSPSVLLRNADVSITLTPATPYSDTPITMRETKPGFISKKYSSPVSRSPTKALCHPLEPCSTPMTIQNGTSVRAAGTQTKSPETITNGLGRYSVVMTSPYFPGSNCGRSLSVS